MLIVGYVFGIRSERALCRDVRVNLAYRWFCGLSIEDKIPDHSAFSNNEKQWLKRSLHTEEVVGSIPTAPTSAINGLFVPPGN
jgi:transposase